MIRRRQMTQLLTPDEKKGLLREAEMLWKDLQENNLGGYSGINRPYWIYFQFERMIEKYGNRDVGLTWSPQELEKGYK